MRWMAIEALESSVYTVKSDMYATFFHYFFFGSNFMIRGHQYSDPLTHSVAKR